jgi:preprotein translocase subunit SecE
MNSDIIWIIVWVVIIGGIFAWLWKAGHLLRFADYVRQTREELRKCTWPTWDELKASTLLVGVSIVILGGYTVLVDLIFAQLVSWIS